MFLSHTFDDNEESNCCFCCVQENTFSVLMIKVVVSCVNEIWMTAGFKSIRLVDILLSTELLSLSHLPVVSHHFFNERKYILFYNVMSNRLKTHYQHWTHDKWLTTQKRLPTTASQTILLRLFLVRWSFWCYSFFRFWQYSCDVQYFKISFSFSERNIN